MDRNTLTGLVLIGAILIGYSFWMQPSPEEIEAQKRVQDSIAAVQADEERVEKMVDADLKSVDTAKSESLTLDSVAQALQDSLDKIKNKQRFGSFATAANGEEKRHTIQNDFVRFTLSTKGGAPVSGELIEYVTYDSMPLFLFEDESSNFNLNFWLDQNTELSSSELYFEEVPDEMTDSRAVYRIYGDNKDQY